MGVNLSQQAMSVNGLLVCPGVLIRQCIPKGTNFTKLTNDDIEFIENRLNYRPRN